MAKISPFLVKASEEASAAGVGIMSKSESNLSFKGNEDVIEQLRILSEAINTMKTSSAEVEVSNTTNEHLKNVST